MKGLVAQGIGVLVLWLTVSSVGWTASYHGLHETHELLVDSSLVAIQFATGLPPMQQSDVLSGFERIIGIVEDEHAPDGFVVCSLSTGDGYSAFVDTLRTAAGIDFAEPYYLDGGGNPTLMRIDFCVAFEEAVPLEEIEVICDSAGVSIVRELNYMPNVFVLRNLPNSGRGMLELANGYHNLSATRYGHPLFNVKPVLFGHKVYDYYADHQMHAKVVVGDFNQASVWDFAGLDDSIVVAVIDDGVAPHEDLPSARILLGWDAVDGDSVASPGEEQGHGLGCAGIIASDQTTDSISGLSDSSGVFGLAPCAKILPVRIFDDIGWPVSHEMTADAISFAWQSGASVLSCSWGFDKEQLDIAVLTAAIEQAADVGRGGKGCVVVFAAGNDFMTERTSYPSFVEGVIAVGATELDGWPWAYSNYGCGLDIMAPSGDKSFRGDMWTLDQMSSQGYNDDGYYWSCPPGDNDPDYDCKFGGTSGAAPVVSATAALLLAKDSTLARSEVEDIIMRSADTVFNWGAINPPDPWYGWGRVNAFNAVLSLSHGDVNNDDNINLLDLSMLSSYLFQQGSPEPFPSLLLADCNCDGMVNINDLTFLVAYLYQGGSAPQKPCYEFGT